MASAPDKVKQLVAKSANGAVNLSWNATKGAFWYEIYRGSTLIATVTTTTYKDTQVQMGYSYVYRINACNYSQKSKATWSSSVEVEIVYKAISASELVNNFSTYASNVNQYVKVSNLYISSSFFEGNDLYVLAKSGTSYIYVLFEDYNNSWEFPEGIGFYGKTRITYFSASGYVATKKKR